MNLTDLPAKPPLPFAVSGQKNTIPVPSQQGIVNGAASLTDGFPPLTMTPETSGGIAPDGKDMNGILFLLSAIARWSIAGGAVFFDSVFATAAGGYPNRAVLNQLDNPGALWMSTVDANTQNPDSYQGSGNPPGWTSLIVPAFAAVQQGGGPNQLSTKINLGVTSANKVRAALNGADFDNIAFEQWVSGQIVTEANARSTTDSALQVNINNEAAARAAADSGLQSSIAAETTNRTNVTNDLYAYFGQTRGGNQQQRFTPGDGWSVTNQLTFTPIRNGWVFVVASLNASTTTVNAMSNAIYINGAQVNSDLVTGSTTAISAAYCAANVQQIIQQAYLSQGNNSGQSYPACSINLSYIFVPG